MLNEAYSANQRHSFLVDDEMTHCAISYNMNILTLSDSFVLSLSAPFQMDVSKVWQQL